MTEKIKKSNKATINKRKKNEIESSNANTQSK